MKIPEISVIYPTYNENMNIEELVSRVSNALENKYTYEILVVDDDSPDLTWKVAQEIKNKNVRVIRRTKNKGLPQSIREGIEKSKGKYVVWSDADLSMPPELIPKLIYYLKNGYDVSVGSRYAKGGKDVRPLIRVVTSRMINLATNIILNFKFKDYDSGFVAAKKEVLDDVKIPDAAYGEYCIEFLYDVGNKNYKTKEVGFHFIDRRAGESKTADTLQGLIKFGFLYFMRILKLRFHK